MLDCKRSCWFALCLAGVIATTPVFANDAAAGSARRALAAHARASHLGAANGMRGRRAGRARAACGGGQSNHDDYRPNDYTPSGDGASGSGPNDYTPSSSNHNDYTPDGDPNGGAHDNGMQCQCGAGQGLGGGASTPAPPSVTLFTAVPAEIDAGQGSTLRWAVSGADTITITPDIGEVHRGSVHVQPSATTTYALHATGPGGSALSFFTISVGATSEHFTVPRAATPPDTSSASAPPPPPAPPSNTADDHPAGYNLVWSDEFDGTSLDRSKWCTRYSYGGGAPLQVPDSACTGPSGHDGTLDFLNDEQQRYVDTNARGENMHVVANGVLSLRATKTRADSYAQYESAMIRSKWQFSPTSSTSYYIASRLRLPNVKGTWPALWLASGFGSNGQLTWPPEIDIFEGPLNGVEDRSTMLHMAAHVGGQQTNSGAEELSYADPAYDKAWDNYIAADSLRGVWVNIAAEWTANSICYYVDSVKAACENYRWSDNDGTGANPANLLLNLAVGGGWAGRYGVDDSMFPTQLDVDFVRIYRK